MTDLIHKIQEKFGLYKELILLSLLIIVVLFIPFYLTKDLSFGLFSDYDTRIPLYTYLKDTVSSGHIPTWNPYVATGIPVFGDPLNYYFNPFLTIPILLFSVQTGLKIGFILAVLFAAYSWWLVMTRMGFHKIIRIWSTLLYAFNGGLYAAFASGHIEKWFAFTIFPLLFYILINYQWTMKRIISVSVLLSFLFWTDSIYMFFYAGFFVAVARIVTVIRSSNKKRRIWETVIVCGLVALLISPKLYGYVSNILPILSREINEPLRGSIHLPFTLLPFVIPWKVMFYDRPFFQRTLGFYFNWYEYYAFITPLPLLFTYYLRRKISFTPVIVLCVLIFAGLLFMSAQYWYSPVKWAYELFSPLHQFRVPQRITVPLVSLLLLAGSWGLDISWNSFKRKRYIGILLLGSILWSLVLSTTIIRETFEVPNNDKIVLAQEIRTSDNSDYYVLNLACCIQTYLMNNHIPNLNFYNGWKVTSAKEFYPEELIKNNFSILKSQRPKYIIEEGLEYPFDEVGYQIWKRRGLITVWMTDTPTMIPTIHLN